MLKAASNTRIAPLRAASPAAQHTIFQSILLHLLPGALITVVFILLGPWLRQHLPPILTLLIPILVALVPFELGVLFFLGYRRNGRLSLEGIVLNRKPLPVKDYLIFAPGLLFWSVLFFLSLGVLDQAVLKGMFGWLPDWFQINQFSPSDYSQTVLTGSFVVYLLLNGIIGPVVEEMYFRGFLLPRIEYLKGWATLVNVVLFSLYHFFSPWQNITRIIAFLPMPYVVRWKKNIYLSMIAHCLLNIGSCMMAVRLFFP